MMASYQVGDAVLCHGIQGTVQFVGTTEFSPGVWVGVNLAKARGKHDGSVDGVRYFTAKDYYGIFVTENSPVLTPYDEKIAACIKMQSLARQRNAIAKKKTTDLEDEKSTFRAWDSLDRKQEQDALINTAMTSDVHQILQQRGAKPHEKTGTRQLRALKSNAQLELPSGKEDYTLEFCTSLVRQAKKLKVGESLARADMVQQVLYHFTLLMDEISHCMNRISPPTLGKLVVVGDTHGQLEDVLWIFFKHGLPSPENVYLFNGDMTDRGPMAVCLWVLLLSFKLYDPSIIHFNRGNHEDDSMNSSYGFLDELTRKYGERGFDLYRNFQYIFCTLPLFTVVSDKILVLHAGLPRQAKHLKLSQLAEVDYRKPIPDRPRTSEDTLFFDTVWSDPSAQEGSEPNSRGPDVVSWGPDVTREFLKNNNLSMIIRSHQVPSTLRGFEWHHDKQVLTIFSASNYCGVSGNQGGVAIIDKSFAKPADISIVEHWAPDWVSAIELLVMLEKDTEKATDVIKMEAINVIESRAVAQAKREMRSHIEEEITAQAKPLFVLHKKALFEYWESIDTNRDLHITVKQWQEGCASICDDKLPWKKLQHTLGIWAHDVCTMPSQDLDESRSSTGRQLVQYVAFLNRYRIGFAPAPDMPEIILGWEERVAEELYRILLRADLSVEATFAAIDHNRDGSVSWDELKKLLEQSSLHVTPKQAQEVLLSLGARENQRINMLKFIDRLRRTFRRSNLRAVDQKDEWIPATLDKLSLTMLKDAQDRLLDGKSPKSAASSSYNTLLITRWFEDADSNSNGYLTFSELYEAINRLPESQVQDCFAHVQGSREDAVRSILAYCDVDETGYLNYLEFIQFLSFFGEDRRSEYRESELDIVCSAVYFHTLAIQQAVRYFDPQGMVTPLELAESLQAVSTAYNTKNSNELFTQKQATILADTPCVDSNGKINSLAFLASFRLIDTHGTQPIGF